MWKSITTTSVLLFIDAILPKDITLLVDFGKVYYGCSGFFPGCKTLPKWPEAPLNFGIMGGRLFNFLLMMSFYSQLRVSVSLYINSYAAYLCLLFFCLCSSTNSCEVYSWFRAGTVKSF